MARITAAVLAMLVSTASAPATDCDGRTDLLGTSRVLAVDAKATPRVGLKQFPTTLPLADHEVVLTFDDGPWPGTTPRVLDALAEQCVKATFFVIGQNAAAHPALLHRELAEGHRVAHHTWSHQLLDRIPQPAAEAEIDRGITSDEQVLYGDEPRHKPMTPFFRFPGFAATPALLDRLAARGIVVFGADLWASDWNPMTPQAELALVLHRLESAGRGIVLLHDTKAQTAAMLPTLLRELKKRGYRVVAVVPAPIP